MINNHKAIAPEILDEIDIFIENFYPQSVTAGNEMASVELSSSQVRSLETLVTSATRFSEVINYIKNQIGKDKQKKWSHAGSSLLGQLEQIEAKSESMKNLFRITDRSLTDLEIEGIPEPIISKIKKIDMLPYAAEEKFRNIVERLIGDELDDEGQKTLLIIFKFARIEPLTILNIKMILVRKWCKQVVSQYFYKMALMGKKDENMV